MLADVGWCRVKLPKSFLAVNLSESHTFHKAEQSEESESLPGASADGGSGLVSDVVRDMAKEHAGADEKAHAE